MTIEGSHWTAIKTNSSITFEIRQGRISNVIVWTKQCLILTKRQTTNVCCNGGVQRHATDRR